MKSNNISIILPVYNQADHIHTIVDEYEQVLANLPYPYELLLVVNGCRDDSLAVCESLTDTHERVRVVHSIKGGWGLAVKLGLREAQGDLICYTNSARTTPQDLLLMLLYAVSNPGVVIKANRKIREAWQRRIGSLLYNIQCRTLFDLSYWDINGTPKVFPRSYQALMQLTRDDDLIDAEFNVLCRQHNYPMIEVPVFSTKRHGGRSTTNYRSALKMYMGAFRLWLERRTR